MCRSRLWLLYWVRTAIRRYLGVDQVGQHEVDQPVVAAERHRRLGAVRGQRGEPLAFTAGQDDAEHPLDARMWRNVAGDGVRRTCVLGGRSGP